MFGFHLLNTKEFIFFSLRTHIVLNFMKIYINMQIIIELFNSLPSQIFNCANVDNPVVQIIVDQRHVLLQEYTIHVN